MVFVKVCKNYVGWLGVVKLAEALVLALPDILHGMIFIMLGKFEKLVL